MNFLLIGPRGCGKSILGSRVADRLGLEFVDLDERVMACFPQESVAAIWEAHGEEAWRQAETQMLNACLLDDGRLIALGGGVPMIDESFAQLMEARHSGKAAIAYLRCPVEELQDRLRAETGDRPSLFGDDPVEEVPVVLSLREPTYLALADHVLDMQGLDMDASTRTIADWIGAQIDPET